MRARSERRTFAALLLVTLCAAGSVAAGQDGMRDALEPGDRVEIAAPTPEAEPVPATVLAVQPRWFSFAVEGDSTVWTRRFDVVESLRVSVGRSRLYSARRGAVWGAYVGTAVGLIAGPLAALSVFGDHGVARAMLVLGGAGGAAGGAAGAAAGAVLARERWVPYRRVGGRE